MGQLLITRSIWLLVGQTLSYLNLELSSQKKWGRDELDFTITGDGRA